MPTSRSVSRRTVLATALASASAWLPDSAGAQAAWPNKSLKIVDVYAPGGSTDTMARMVAAKLSARLGQTIIVENRTGAGGTLGTDYVAKSPPDGYTLLLTSTAMPTNVASGKKLPYDLMKDLAPLGLIGVTPLLIVVPADSPFKTLRDLVEAARAKPGDGVRYGSSGVGAMSHIGMELLASEAKVQFLHVPYKGVSLATSDLLGGQIQAMLGTVATYSKLLEAGRMRGLVVTSPKRSPFLPDLPTSVEAGFPDFQIEFWWGLMGPAGMPADMVKRINSELAGIVAEPDVRETLARFAALPKPMTPEEFGKLNEFEITRWRKVIKGANIVVE